MSTIRIDAVPSQTGTLVGGMTAEMDKFMLLYTKITSESVVELYDHDGFSVSFTGEIVPFEGGKDVAAYIDRQSGDLMATVAVMDGNDVQVHEYNFNTTMLSAPTILSVGDVYYPYPRIEAFGYYDAPTSMAKWTVAASWMGSLYDEIRVFTDVSPMYIANAGIGDKHEYPTVAAGIGPQLTSVPADYIGNKQYSFAWAHTNGSPPNYYAKSIDVFGVPIDPTDFHIVNRDPVAPTSDPWDGISMSHSCNSGRGTVTAWNDGEKIMYKIRVDNDYKFRPGAEEDDAPKVLPMPATVYPNPAKDFFIVKNAKVGSQLELINALGQVVLQENISSTHTKIDLHKVAAGSYFVKFTDAQGKNQSHKLLLQ